MNKHASYRTVFLLTLSLLLFSCSPTLTELKQAKEYHQKGEYQRVAGMELSCGATDEGCNQLHLVKGDACFRLAKGGDVPKKNYECAVSDLKQGIAMTTQWTAGDFTLPRAQSYENLCESLRNLQDMETGAGADNITRELKKTSGEFASAEPEHPVVPYFKGIADFTLMRRCLLHPDQCPSVCADIKSISAGVSEGMKKSAGTRYEDNYRRLLSDIETAKKSLQGCR